MKKEFFESLIAILGQTNVTQNKEDLQDVSHDYTEDLIFLPEILIFPENSMQVSECVKLCSQFNVPIYTRGAGTGLSGACLPVKGGLVLSTKKMNRILEIDTQNMMATVEPGLINIHLKQALEPYNLTYPPDPASFGSSTIGGNVAHGAGGPKAVKYGTTRDYILNLEVVLPNGEIIWTGANTLKNSTGFSLTHLFIGSEGLLGIITKIVVKLVPKTQHELLMLAMFENAEDAAVAVNKVLLSGVLPTGLELMEVSGVKIASEATKTNFPIPTNVEFYLLIILDGNLLDELMLQAEQIFPILDENGAFEVLMPNNAQMAEDWWKVRRSIGETVKQQSIYKEEDTVVPRAYLPQLLTGVKEIGAKYGFRTVCYGHAGDGNLHVNILKDQLSDEKWEIEIPKGITEIFELCKKLGGTISGEHGVGFVQKPYLDVVFTPDHWRLMKGIKTVFDPQNILNPGKWIESRQPIN
jgi:glycolate oxidase